MENSKTKIICTLGPASCSESVLKMMISAGMNIARLNFSHGNCQSHQKMIDILRQTGKKCGQNIPILQDLEGFRVRVGRFKGSRKSIELKNNTTVTLIKAQVSDKKDIIPFDYDGSLYDIKAGCNIYIDDGNLTLKVKTRRKDFIKAEVVIGGILKEHKGINIPACELKFKGLTEKDKENILFGINNKVDMIAQSFVRDKDDILAVREFINKNGFNCPLIAKIENRQGVDNIDRILEVSDGIMIARGDMGVSLPVFQVPMIQKYIIKKCATSGRFDITATQMLESMTDNRRPTRAEVSDVANAILDGSDYVMLSAETAAGKYPVEAVKMMQDIIDFTTSARLTYGY